MLPSSTSLLAGEDQRSDRVWKIQISFYMAKSRQLLENWIKIYEESRIYEIDSFLYRILVYKYPLINIRESSRGEFINLLERGSTFFESSFEEKGTI